MTYTRLLYLICLLGSMVFPLLYTGWVYTHLSSSPQMTRFGGHYVDQPAQFDQLADGQHWSLVFATPDQLNDQSKHQLEQLYRRWLMLGSKRPRTQLVWLVDPVDASQHLPNWYAQQSVFKLLDNTPYQLIKTHPVVYIVSPNGQIGIEHPFDLDVGPIFSDLMYLLKVG